MTNDLATRCEEAVGAFNPAAHMEAPFRAFLAAAEECAEQGFMVFMRPDKESAGGWTQKLFILPQSAILARAAKETP